MILSRRIDRIAATAAAAAAAAAVLRHNTNETHFSNTKSVDHSGAYNL